MRTTVRTDTATPLLALAAALLAAAILAPARGAAAQSAPGPIPANPGASAQQPPERTVPLRVSVDLVNTPVVVTDAKGNMVLDLAQKDFRVSDNGVRQQIDDFDMGGGPLSVAIVVETSARVGGLLPELRKTGILFTQDVLGPDGDATVIGYNDEVDRLLPFTADRDAIEKTFSQLQEGVSGSRLYDAMSQAEEALRGRPAARRRVIVVLGEAADTGSEETAGQVLRDAQLANITIYSVGLSPLAAAARGSDQNNGPAPIAPPGIQTQPPIPGPPQTPENQQLSAGNVNLTALAKWAVMHATSPVRDHPLDVIAVGTGGLYVTSVKDKSIEEAIDRIGDELHASYTLSYRPMGTNPNAYHEIRVTVDRAGLKVRTRPGYFPGGTTPAAQAQ